MRIEQTGAGLEARLSVTGFARYFAAAFLAFWLTGWATGEWFALWTLARGVRSFLTGEPPKPGHEPAGAGALAVGAFLVVWLTFWTIGGLFAARELLRMLFGRDRILARHDGIEVEHSYGLFRSVKRLSREEIRRFYRTTPRAALFVETTRGPKVLTSLGTPDERAELEQALNAEFHIAAQSAPEGALPRGWCEVSSLEHDPVLVKDPETRRKQAITAWIVCAVLSLVPLYLLSAVRERLDLLAPILFFGALTAATAWGAIWLSFGRNEWRLEKGRLVLQRRFGHNRTQRFEAVSLELIEDNSGDDGPSYLLTAMAAGAPAQSRSHSAGKHRRTLHSKSDDPTEPRAFGLWLNRRCQIPFVDLTTAAAKAKDLEVLKQQLAGSGRTGRALLWIVERLAPSRPRRDE